ncbi:MAG: hypothetical protein AAFW83_14450 [Pseudomonadota bacterium]
MPAPIFFKEKMRRLLVLYFVVMCTCTGFVFPSIAFEKEEFKEEEGSNIAEYLLMKGIDSYYSGKAFFQYYFIMAAIAHYENGNTYGAEAVIKTLKEITGDPDNENFGGMVGLEYNALVALFKAEKYASRHDYKSSFSAFDDALEFASKVPELSFFNRILLNFCKHLLSTGRWKRCRNQLKKVNRDKLSARNYREYLGIQRTILTYIYIHEGCSEIYNPLDRPQIGMGRYTEELKKNRNLICERE